LSAPKIQKGIDWLYFELKPALKAKSLSGCRSALGSASMGVFVSPLQTDLMFPIQQMVSTNLDAEEEGWGDAYRNTNKAIEEMKELVGASEFDEALTSFEKVRKNINFIVSDVNDRWEEKNKPFRLLDDGYDEGPTSREALYQKAKKDKMNERNAAGGAGAALSILR
jgi:hypothetical protein